MDANASEEYEKDKDLGKDNSKPNAPEMDLECITEDHNNDNSGPESPSMMPLENDTTTVDYGNVVRGVTLSARKKCNKALLHNMLKIRKTWYQAEANMDDDLPKIFVCCACNLRFHCYEDLEEHISRTTGHLIFRCQICFMTMEVLNLCQIVFHASDFHVNEAGLYPKKIPMELIQIRSFGKMITLKEVCSECRKGFGSIIAHLWSNKPDDPAFQCPYCSTFVSRNVCRYNLHIKVHKNISPYRCPDCAKKFQDYVHFHYHLNDNCRHKEQTTRYKCPCGLIFNSKLALGKHIFSDHNDDKYKCHLCPAEMNVASEKNLHYEEHHLDELTASALRRCKRFINYHNCILCQRENLKGFIYERHVRDHLGGSYCKLPLFVCNCGFITMYKGTYLTHKSVPCQTFEFSSLSNCSARMKMCATCLDLKFYNGKEPFVCESCKTLEANNSCLFYECSLCKNLIKYSMDYVILHLRIEHNILDEEMPYKYVKMKILNSFNGPLPNEGAEKSDLNLNHRCKICAAGFLEKDHLRTHYMSTHRRGSLGFDCQVCGKALQTAKLLLIHLRTHRDAVTDELPTSDVLLNDSLQKLVCAVCSQKFSNPTEHSQHLRSHGMAFLKVIKHT